MESINFKDTPSVLASVVMLSIFSTFVNLFVDLLYAFVDPRIKSQYQSSGGDGMFDNVRTRKAEVDTAAAVNRDRTLFQQAWMQFRRNKRAMFGLAVIILLFLIVIVTMAIDMVTSNSVYNDYVIKQNLYNKLDGPSLAHPLGCDEFGRDLLFRILWGTKYSLLLGFCAVSFALLVGGTLGMIAGFYGGQIDNVIMRVMDVFMACPFILLAMAIVAALGASTVNLLIALGVSGMASFSRITRAAVMSVKDKEFVEAARAVGANDFVILIKYILPNSMAPILVQLTLRIGSSILNVAGLVLHRSWRPAAASGVGRDSDGGQGLYA